MVQYEADRVRMSGGRAIRHHPRTRSEVLVLHEEEAEDAEGGRLDDGGGGKAMLMNRFINSQEGER